MTNKKTMQASALALWVSLNFTGCASLPDADESRPLGGQNNSASCDEDLIPNMVRSRVYNNFITGGFRDADGSFSKNIEQDVQAYREKRGEAWTKIFGCDGEDKELRELAEYMFEHQGFKGKDIYETIGYQDKFSMIFAILMEKHMSDVKAFFPIEHFDEMQKDLMQRISFEGRDDVDEEVLNDMIMRKIDENYDELALLAMKDELSSFFKMDASSQRVNSVVFHHKFNGIVKNEVQTYMKEFLPQKMQKENELYI